jgi:hypothetical protein
MTQHSTAFPGTTARRLQVLLAAVLLAVFLNTIAVVTHDHASDAGVGASHAALCSFCVSHAGYAGASEYSLLPAKASQRVERVADFTSAFSQSNLLLAAQPRGPPLS